MSDEALSQMMWATTRQRQSQMKPAGPTGGFDWGLNHLSQYFDVTTKDVIERILWSAIPIQRRGPDTENADDVEELMAPLAEEGLMDPQQSEKATNAYPSNIQRPYSYMERFIQSRPDFYGPFWVSATLVFVIAILSNITSFAQFHSKLMSLAQSDSMSNGATDLNQSAEVFSEKIRNEIDSWHYSMDELNMSSSLIMFYVTMIPTFMWFLFWFRGCSSYYTLTETVCAYGYLMITLAAALSGIVLVLSFLPVVRSDPNPASSHIILALVPLFQFGLAYIIHRIMLQ